MKRIIVSLFAVALLTAAGTSSAWWNDDDDYYADPNQEVFNKDRSGATNIVNFPRIPTNRHQFVTFRSDLKQCIRPLFRKGEERMRACDVLDLAFKWEPEDPRLFRVYDDLDIMDMLVSAELVKQI